MRLANKVRIGVAALGLTTLIAGGVTNIQAYNSIRDYKSRATEDESFTTEINNNLNQAYFGAIPLFLGAFAIGAAAAYKPKDSPPQKRARNFIERINHV